MDTTENKKIIKLNHKAQRIEDNINKTSSNKTKTVGNRKCSKICLDDLFELISDLG